MNNYVKLASIDVGNHIEKKGSLSYLSWAWAVDRLLREDPLANWEYHEPKFYGDTVMVSVTVTAFGKPVTMQLPVMDHRNNAVSSPDARKISDAQMRAIVKAIACHGLGLYIYAGQDLPEDAEPVKNPLDNLAKPAPAPAPAPKPEPRPTGSYALHIPGKPDQLYNSIEEWQNGFEELGARIMASKLPPESKLEKLDSLAHTNKAMMQTLPATSRISHTASYAKRKADLGLG